MIILKLLGFISILILINCFIDALRIRTKSLLIMTGIVTSVVLYLGVIRERFIEKDLTTSFNNELVYLQDNCSSKIKLPRNFVVRFGKTGDAIGYCQKYLNGFKIVISPWYWNNYLDSFGRHQLLLHEMMHCVFDVRHKSDPHHFMAPEFDDIKPEELDRQVKELLKEVC